MLNPSTVINRSASWEFKEVCFQFLFNIQWCTFVVFETQSFSSHPSVSKRFTADLLKLHKWRGQIHFQDAFRCISLPPLLWHLRAGQKHDQGDGSLVCKHAGCCWEKSWLVSSYCFYNAIRNMLITTILLFKSGCLTLQSLSWFQYAYKICTSLLYRMYFYQHLC